MYLYSREDSLGAKEANNAGLTPLHMATSRGHIGLVRFHIWAGASLRARDTNGLTPLHTAAMNGHIKSVVYLMEMMNRADFESASHHQYLVVHL